jgi:hypothetical protein
MKGTFDCLRGYVKTHKPNIDITIDKIDASEDFSYFLFLYRESFSEKETDKITIDVMHSAVMILRKNEKDIWKCVLWKIYLIEKLIREHKTQRPTATDRLPVGTHPK